MEMVRSGRFLFTGMRTGQGQVYRAHGKTDPGLSFPLRPAPCPLPPSFTYTPQRLALLNRRRRLARREWTGGKAAGG